MGWFPMAKGVANMSRYREVTLAANRHYLEALSAAGDPALPSLANHQRRTRNNDGNPGPSPRQISKTPRRPGGMTISKHARKSRGCLTERLYSINRLGKRISNRIPARAQVCLSFAGIRKCESALLTESRRRYVPAVSFGDSSFCG